MVGLLTFGNKKYESLDSEMRSTIGPLYDATQKMLPLIDKDTEAFNDYMVCNMEYHPLTHSAHGTVVKCLHNVCVGCFEVTSKF